ncbi:MAG: gentisate 1,2-dioxygenase [Alphaproteobacteria bacterium]|nr:gentisate 1,2-dioxygenase [Alphaproteobacteria bacterium]
MTIRSDVRPDLLPYYKEDCDPKNLAPLWEVLHTFARKEPKSDCEPYIWHYDEIRDTLMKSANLITAEQAERRVLILENPGMRGRYRVTTSLFAGLQLIMPGEIAPAHRHTQAALRFIVEGSGAYTAVDGEKTIMSEGDFVITPSWTWHDHGNQSENPMVWLDGLDVPLVETLDTTFAEPYGEKSQGNPRPSGDSLARYGSGLLPVDHEQRSPSSPVFNYPYTRTREALEIMRKTDEWDPCHGLKLRYVNPENGDSPMPTIGTFMQLLPKGFETSGYRCSDGTVYSVVEGTGKSVIGDQTFEWGPRDHFVIPCWVPQKHTANEDAVLFSFSDRPAQQKLGLWREDRGNA